LVFSRSSGLVSPGGWGDSPGFFPGFL
jgi:hypothetical protein